jgi:DNA invertase Pin-like site-specific DNA recombinase
MSSDDRVAKLIRARTGEGRKRAKERGVRFGRPRKMTPHQRQEALRRLAGGETQADVARSTTLMPPRSEVQRPPTANSWASQIALRNVTSLVTLDCFDQSRNERADVPCLSEAMSGS